jgi:amino acid transporter
MKLVLQAALVIVLATLAAFTLIAALALAGLKAWLLVAVTVIVVVWLLKRRPGRLQLPWPRS